MCPLDCPAPAGRRLMRSVVAFGPKNQTRRDFMIRDDLPRRLGVVYRLETFYMIYIYMCM